MLASKSGIRMFYNSAIFVLVMLIGQNSMSKTLKVFTGEDHLAPYDFGIDSSVLGTVNPVLFGYLLRSSETQEVLPGLIRKWSYDFKSLKYRLILGKDKFHNGRNITSQDLEFSILRGFLSDKENYNRIHFSDIIGIETLRPGMKFKSGMIPGLKVINENTIEISLKTPNPIFLINFTIPFVPLVPQEELNEDYFTWKKYPVGAGPYKIEKDYKDNVLILKSVKSAPADVAEFIEYHTARKTNSYDIIFDRVTASEEEVAFKKVFSKYPVSINSIFFYRENDFNANINFRKAIYYALDRDRIVLGSEQFKPAYEMNVRPYIPGESELKNPFNLDLARNYVKKLPPSFLEKKFIIGVYSPNKIFTPIMKDRIKVMSSQLEKIGLKINFEPNSEKFPTSEIMKKYSMKLWSKVVDLSDPSISFGAMSSLSPYKNEMPDSHGEYDRIYNIAMRATTYEERLKSIQDISHLIEEQTLIVPIMQKYVMFRYNPKTVESLGDQAKPLFMDLLLVKMK